MTQTYVDEDEPWLGILAASEFAIFSTTNRLKGYSPGQLVFGRDIIILIKHTVDWELIRQQNQTQIDKDNIREIRSRVDHDYNFLDEVMLNDHAAYKHETPYKGPFVIKKCWTNGTVNIQYSAIKIRHNIRQIKPYKSNTKVGDINPKNMCDDVNI